jgi:hypothetical protein
MKRVVINVIHHTDKLTDIEANNLKRLVTLNDNKRDIVFILPKSFSSSYLKKKYKSINFYFVDNNLLSSAKEYNKFLITKKYYNIFDGYEYLLVYQLDTWVFSLDFEYFMDLGFDLIGAPIFSENRHLEIEIINGCNGGISLRKLQSFKRILDKPFFFNLNSLYCDIGFGNHLNEPIKVFMKRLISRFIVFYKPDFFWPIHLNEDLYWSVIVPKFDREFKVASTNYSIGFCFDQFPQFLYEKNNNRLPLFVHALEKYDYTFWKRFI